MEELKQLENYLNLANKRGAFELAESVKVVNAVINLSKILQEKDREIADLNEKIRRFENKAKSTIDNMLRDNVDVHYSLQPENKKDVDKKAK